MDLKVENISDKEYRLMQEIEKLKHIIDTSKVEKQQLISFLEIKLKRITNRQKEETGLDFAYSEGYIDMIKTVLDFINKGGKDE